MEEVIKLPPFPEVCGYLFIKLALLLPSTDILNSHKVEKAKSKRIDEAFLEGNKAVSIKITHTLFDLANTLLGFCLENKCL